VSDWWRSARDRAQILTRERRLGTRGRYISVASLVHFLRHNFLTHKDLTAKEFLKLRWQRLQIFFPRPRVGWNQHPREPHTSATLSISQDVTTPIYIFNIINTYIFINLSFKLFIYLINLFIIFCRSSSAVRRPLFHPLQSPAFLSEMVRSTTQHCLCWPRKLTVLTTKGTNLIVFMVNTNVNCRSCMLIRNIWCWTLN